jgi:hypothetical protein
MEGIHKRDRRTWLTLMENADALATRVAMMASFMVLYICVYKDIYLRRVWCICNLQSTETPFFIE